MSTNKINSFIILKLLSLLGINLLSLLEIISLFFFLRSAVSTGHFKSVISAELLYWRHI